MKKFTLFFGLLLMAATTFAQAPAGINYQTLVRDADGSVLPNTELSIRLSIHSLAPDGELVYSEIHNLTTNAMGLVNLIIGEGETQTGDFAAINWGVQAHFLETALDIEGNGNFQVMGSTQFLSVPYSMFSNAAQHATTATGLQTFTTIERDAIENPSTGMQIFNSTTNCLNYYNGSNWFETCGNCTPFPTIAEAGEDIYINDVNTTINLDGNTPLFGSGMWSIVSGEGGSLENPSNPETLFTGLHCAEYALCWTIANACGSSQDTLLVKFDATPSTALAGNDQLFADNTTETTLAANTPEVGEGFWAIISGNDGIIADSTNPNSTFTGIECESYLLHWTIATDCNTSTDEVNISFNSTPTVANAGDDLWYVVGSWANLAANIPENGSGQWEIVSGEGATLIDATNPETIFIGQNNTVYQLTWTISTVCATSIDSLYVSFGNAMICGITPLIDSRDSNRYATVQIGNQCWMQENLAYLPSVYPSSSTSSSNLRYYVYDYQGTIVDSAKSTLNYQTYGVLYNWPAANTACPDGWHLPSNGEYCTLWHLFDQTVNCTYFGHTGTNIGGTLKTTGTIQDSTGLWNAPNMGATNESGFSVLPGGFIGDGQVTFTSIFGWGGFWSSSAPSAGKWMWAAQSSVEDIYNMSLNRDGALSVRCLKD